MSLSLLRLLSFICLARKAWCHYCEWDLCGSEQYCCGDNLCCDYVYRHWYFWVGVVFLVLLISACGGIFRYYYSRQWRPPQHHHHTTGPYHTTTTTTTATTTTPYTPLPTHISPHDPTFMISQGGHKTEM